MSVAKEYEFNEYENQQMLRFLQSIIYLCIALIFAGTVTIIQGIIPEARSGDVFVGIIFMLMAFAFFMPVRNFLNILSTEGKDMSQFMRGFRILSGGLTFIIAAFSLLLITTVVSYFKSI